jgi:hypothetical protein
VQLLCDEESFNESLFDSFSSFIPTSLESSRLHVRRNILRCVKKRLHPRVTLGPSLSEISQFSFPSSIVLSSAFTSSNPFAPLSHESEYSPLAYIDVDIKSADSKKWKSARAMVDCGGQSSFINDNLSQGYRLPRLPKQHPVSLVLADEAPFRAEHIIHYNSLVL